MLRSYQDLKVWQKSYDLCLQVYRLTRAFPASESYGLTSQMRRAAVSVPSNIAEGYGRTSTAEYLRSLRIAYGSNCELETQAMISKDLSYVKLDDAARLKEDIREVERMLKALMRSLSSPAKNLRRSNPRPLGPSNPS